ncbi:MAG TPA: hypothetical protein VE800_08405, partial [Actinomycetota bacterium]|nr:hypothetical protein [Actinomycetota bacterium]
NFDNQDEFAHNVSIYADPEYSKPVQQTPFDETAPVSESVTYDFDPIPEPGTLYFQCDFHPQLSMRGVFAVVEGEGGGGNGGGGGGG